jgi:hypothetical protein
MTQAREQNIPASCRGTDVMPTGEQDVAQELAELKARLRRMEIEPAPELTPLQKAIAEVNANWYLIAKLPAPADAPPAWRLVYFVKRVARRVMVELLNTIVGQQNAFNAQVARAITELAKENAELKAKLEEIERMKNV